MLNSSAPLREVFTDPSYTRAQRAGVADAMVGLLQVKHPALTNFFKLVNERNRMAMLPEMARCYQELSDEKVGRIRGTVTTAIPMSAADLSNLSQTLQNLLGKQVVLTPAIDARVLGGAVAQLGPWRYDGTLRAGLDEMAKVLSGR